MKPDQQHVSSMVADTIILLCKNGLSFKSRIKVQGLIGITVDDGDVFLVQIGETVENGLDDKGGEAVGDRCHRVLRLSNNGDCEGESSARGGGGGELSNQFCQPNSLESYAANVYCSQDGQLRTAQTFRQRGKSKAHKNAIPCYNVSDDVITIKDEVEENGYQTNSSFGSAFAGGGDHPIGDDGQTVLPAAPKFLDDFGDMGVDAIGIDAVKTERDDFETFERDNFGENESEMFPSGSQFGRHVKQEFEYYMTGGLSTYESSSSRGNGSRQQSKQEKTKPRKDKYKSILTKYKQQQQQQQPYVVTKSLHECGYPNCGKQFRHKQHLLRHQTQKHGRQPTKLLNEQKVWVRPGCSDADYEDEDYM